MFPFHINQVALVFNNLPPKPWQCTVSKFPWPVRNQLLPRPGTGLFCFVFPLSPVQGTMETGVCTQACGTNDTHIEVLCQKEWFFPVKWCSVGEGKLCSGNVQVNGVTVKWYQGHVCDISMCLINTCLVFLCYFSVFCGDRVKAYHSTIKFRNLLQQ